MEYLVLSEEMVQIIISESEREHSKMSQWDTVISESELLPEIVLPQDITISSSEIILLIHRVMYPTSSISEIPSSEIVHFKESVLTQQILSIPLM
jgi:hypothetical protein